MVEGLLLHDVGFSIIMAFLTSLYCYSRHRPLLIIFNISLSVTVSVIYLLVISCFNWKISLLLLSYTVGFQ